MNVVLPGSDDPFFVGLDPRASDFDRGEPYADRWFVEGILREGQGLVIAADSREQGSDMARSLAHCLAFGTSYLGVAPSRTCDVAYVSPYTPTFISPFRLGGPAHAIRDVHVVVDHLLLDREEDRSEIFRFLCRLPVEVAIFDPADFAGPRPVPHSDLVRAAEVCLLIGVTPVFVLLRGECSLE